MLYNAGDVRLAMDGGKEVRLRIAGYLLLLSGLLLTGGAMFMSLMFYSTAQANFSRSAMPQGLALAVVGMLGIPGVAAGVVAFLGGIYALRKRAWALSFTGSILSLVIPPLGVASGVLLVLERKEWSRTARRLSIGIVSVLGFFAICLWVLAQLL